MTIDFDALDPFAAGDRAADQKQEPDDARRGTEQAHRTQRPRWMPYEGLASERLSTLTVHHYRGLDDLTLESIGKINLIVGANNTRKTTLLEAVYLLAHQNDEEALFDLIRWRSRVPCDDERLIALVPGFGRISGRFDEDEDEEVAFCLERSNDQISDDDDDRAAFLGRVSIEGTYGEYDYQTSDSVFYRGRPRDTVTKGHRILWPTAFSSPSAVHRPETLARSNRASLERGTKIKIVEFLREHIDPGVHSIEWIDEHGGFLVSHVDFDRARDLSTFGTSFRRIFEMSLLFADVRSGIVLIDDFESGLHAGLLRDVARFVQTLASEMKVQVFLTTHSKEAVDAFVLSKDRASDLAGYAMIQTGKPAKPIEARRFSGEELQKLHEAVNFDLRML